MDAEKFKVEMQARAAKLGDWLDLIESNYAQVISRREETASLAGFDPEPNERPCEHALAYRRRKLCLACGNSGWRKLTSDERKADQLAREQGKPREEWFGVDRYGAQVSAGVTIVKDESPAVKKARASEQLDVMIDALRRNERIREGLEPTEDRALHDLRIVSRQPRVMRRIQRGLDVLRIARPDLYDAIPSERGLVALATAMYYVAPGRIPPV